MNTLWAVHGWRTKGAYMDRLETLLQARGVNCHDFDYGKAVGPLQTRVATNAAAHALSSASVQGDGAIGHSNGCNVILQAIWKGAPLQEVHFLSPALKRDAKLPSDWKGRIYVHHTRHDKALALARILRWTNWGDMGRVGYRGTDERFLNYDHQAHIGGHSAWYHDDWSVLPRLRISYDRYPVAKEN